MNPANINPNASCSEDQAAAQQLSRQLRVAQAPTPPVPLVGYTRLGQPPTLPVPQPPQAPPPSAELPVHVGAEGWNRLLAEAAAYSGAKELFIVDTSGLPVATQGIPATFDVERVGSRLVLAFDQADRMGERACRHLTIDLGSRTLTGVRLVAPEAGPLMLGILSDRPLTPEQLEGLSGR